jgi:hypothetical protein
MAKQEPPLCFRATEEDKSILHYLQERLGVTSIAQVIKIAIRRLRDSERRRERS